MYQLSLPGGLASRFNLPSRFSIERLCTRTLRRSGEAILSTIRQWSVHRATCSVIAQRFAPM